MPAPRTVRLDDDAQAAADYLAAEDSDASFSDIVRKSLLETAWAHRRAALRAEALAVREDTADAEEMRAVMADMEALGAW